MAYLQWKDELSVGIDVLDLQHRQIFDLINGLFDHIAGPESETNDLDRILLRLQLFTETHFRCEEVYLKLSGFQDYEDHRHLHATMIRQSNALIRDLKNKTTTLQELLLFLKKWWLNHVCREDRKYMDSVRLLA
jgi:hemerythrin-like metal-binding protein